MLLIDAYNVIQTPGVLPPDLAGLDVAGLAALIARSRYARRGARLVCDGGPEGQAEAVGPAKGIEILFAGPGREADDLIDQMLRSGGGARGMLVVSSDRRVQKMAHRRKARTLSSPEFLAQLTHDQGRRPPEPRPAFAKAIPLDRGSIAYWLREFGLVAEPEPGAEVSKTHAGEIAAASGATGRPPAVARPPMEVGPVAPPGGPSERSVPPSTAAIDPLILEAMRMWPGQIHPDDLDMTKWLEPENKRSGSSRGRPRRR